MKIINIVAISTILIFLITTNYLARGRSIKEENNILKSDGLEILDPKIEINYVEASAEETCEPVYGFLPCTNNILGQLFMIVVYQYLLSLGGSYVSAGSDLFFKLTGPGVFGASLFHILPAFPQISLVLVSGLSSSSGRAANQAAMGMAVNAGSAVMLLTLVWGSCIVFGSFDLSQPSSSSTTNTDDDDTQSTKKSLTGLGVRTDDETSDTARIMFLALVPYLILQLAKILNSSTGIRVVILIALIVTLLFLFTYSIYQIFRPWIQNRRFEYMTQKFVKDKLLALLSQHGRPNVPLIKEIFNEIDKNKDGTISTVELRVLILGIKLQEHGTLNEDYIKTVMEAMDLSGDDRINQDEFVRVLSKWLTDAKKSVANKRRGFLSRLTDNLEEEQQSLIAQKKQSARADSSWTDYLTAALQVFGGTAILALLSMPLIQTVASFSTSANIPSFFIPYVVIPLTMNYGRILGVINSARQKTEEALSLTLSELYGSVFTSCMFGLTIFLSLVYIRNLEWDVSAEVLVVFVICTSMGLFTSLRTEFPRWTGYVAYLLYPISLVFLYVLTSVFGWS